MKIQIIGYSGSGKSTLAKTLSDYYHIPLLYLDTVQFYGNWQERSLEQQNQIVEQFLKDNENWVIDGNYSHIVPQRFEQCDCIIFLDYNRWFCYKEAFKRYIKNRGTSRESCPCIEKFDLEFQKWILFEGRTDKQKDKHLHHVNLCHGEKHVFKTRKQLNHYLESIYQER